MFEKLRFFSSATWDSCIRDDESFHDFVKELNIWNLKIILIAEFMKLIQLENVQVKVEVRKML